MAHQTHPGRERVISRPDSVVLREARSQSGIFYAPIAFAMRFTLILTTLLLPSFVLASICSDDIGKASINELYELGGDRWVEAKLIIPTTDYTGWYFRLCKKQGNNHQCETYPLDHLTPQNNYYLVRSGISNNHFDIANNGEMDVVLFDSSNRAIDYLSVNGYIHQQPTCTDFPYSNTVTTASSPKGIYRMPDGIGDWTELDSPGATGEPTNGSTNDDLDENSVIVTLANITVQPGQPAIFELHLRDHVGNIIIIEDDVEIRFHTFDGDDPNAAIAPRDYEDTYGDVTIPAGQSTAQISVNTHAGADYDTYFYLLITRALQANGDPVYPQPSYSIATFAEPDVSLIYIQLTHPATGLTCAPVDVTFTACADEDCTEQYTGGVEFTLTKNGIAYTNIIIPENNSSTVRGVTHTVAGAVTLGISNINPEASGVPFYQCDPANCQIAFADTGFRLVDSSGTPASYSTQIAGKASDVTPDAEERFIQAVRTDDQSGACTGIFDDGENVAIDFAAECIDPSACTSDAAYNMQLRDYTNSLTTIATTDTATAWSSVTLTFGTNSMAPLPLMYPDVGQMQLHARYSLPNEEGEPSGDYMYGSLAPFVVRPYDFTFTNPTCETNHTDFFCRAGEGFTVDITAVNFDGDTTPNFGNESSAQVVTLEHQLVSPAGGVDGTITYDPDDPDPLNFTDGVASGVTMSWDEVGELALRGKMDGYLGSAAFEGNSWSDPIGRFIPDHFRIIDSDLINRINLFCSPDSSFTYMGEPFEAALTLAAKNSSGNTTANYHGDFARLGDESLNIGAIDRATTSTPLTDRLNATVTHVSDRDWGDDPRGEADYTLSLYIAREASPDGSFDDVAIGINPLDDDGVVLGTLNLDINDDGTDTHGILGSTVIRYGRLRLQNAHGSEQINLPVQMLAEYYHEGGYFITNIADNCTALDLSKHLELNGVSAGGTQVDLSGLNSSGSTAILSSDSPFISGQSTLLFEAPGSSNTGYVDIHSKVFADFPWLGYPWGCESPESNEACARITFGIYQGSDRKIYMRELY